MLRSSSSWACAPSQWPCWRSTSCLGTLSTERQWCRQGRFCWKLKLLLCSEYTQLAGSYLGSHNTEIFVQVFIPDSSPFPSNCVSPTNQDDKEPSVRETSLPDLRTWNTGISYSCNDALEPIPIHPWPWGLIPIPIVGWRIILKQIPIYRYQTDKSVSYRYCTNILGR